MSRTEQAARLLRLTRLDALARRTWSGLLIFNYHRFGRPGAQDDPDLYSATLDDFATHVAELADRFEIVPAGSAEWSEGGPSLHGVSEDPVAAECSLPTSTAHS